MSNKKPVCVMLSVHPEIRDILRIMAAQENLKNPSRVATASGIARRIVCEYIEKLDQVYLKQDQGDNS